MMSEPCSTSALSSITFCLTVRETADLIGMSPARVRYRCRRHQISAFRVGPRGHWRIHTTWAGLQLCPEPEARLADALSTLVLADPYAGGRASGDLTDRMAS